LASVKTAGIKRQGPCQREASAPVHVASLTGRQETTFRRILSGMLLMRSTPLLQTLVHESRTAAVRGTSGVAAGGGRERESYA
jgi:hypothetical protein